MPVGERFALLVSPRAFGVVVEYVERRQVVLDDALGA